MVTIEIEETLKGTLKEVFGYSQFRGNQEAIIRSILEGRNTFVIMPTGAGKSLCYQLPAVMQEGTAIVISPLIALMKNQVDQLNALGINAQFLNSTLSKGEATKVKKQTLSGEVKLLYVAPESLTKEENIEFLRQANISFVAIDEAHCISEWGHDFRPEYRRIKSIIEQLGDLPIIALTATATPKVRADIQKNLRMEEADVFLSSFYRDNLYYDVRAKGDPKKQLIKFIKSFKGKSGVVYCLSRKKVEEVAEFLRVNDIKAAPYHAGMDAPDRMRNQDAFLNEDVDVIVATIAFGMGIDKPDVRFVVHYDAPKSLEGYYQETGRAGRDGMEAHCLMFFSEEDISKLEKFNKDKTVTERDNARLLLQEMSYYAHSTVCRPRQLLHYFGEDMGHDCGKCDNCRRNRERFEAEHYLLLSLSALKHIGSRFSLDHVSNILRGMEEQHVVSHQHHLLPAFGKGAEHDKAFWETVLRQGMIYGFLEKDPDQVTHIRLTAKGEKFLQSPYSVSFTKDHDFAHEQQGQEEEEASMSAGACDEALYEMLKQLRKRIAKQKGFPPYAIFQDPSLEEMATTYPTNEQELAQVNGVGMSKARKFGQPFLELIKRYVEDNDIETTTEVVVKSTVNKSKLKIYIIQQIDRKVDLEEIADSKQVSFDEVLTEIENICYSGTKLNLDYYIKELIEEDRMSEIYEYFMSADTDSLEQALQELDEDISEEEIRLMRIKFLSEVAM